MSRSLTTAENQVLDQVRDKIQAIVAAGDLNRLQATGLLGDPGTPAGQAAYASFHQVFQQLPAQLQQVRAAGRVQVNPGLDPSVKANALTLVRNGAPVAAVELDEDFVAAGSESTIAGRAITLMHELSHTVYQAPNFTVKDFAYRRWWGLEYLIPDVGWRNADTYAEAAARISDGLDNTPGRDAEYGRIAAQRRVLSGLAPGLILGPALAWADLKINRAWLRSADYEGFAKSTVGRPIWTTTLNNWQASPDSAPLLAIEADLRDNKGRIIGERYGVLTVGLSDDSKRTAGNIRSYMTTLKDALCTIKLALPDAGAAITYTPGTPLGVLEVPRTLVTGTSYALGEQIVSALVAALNYTDAADRSTANLNAHKLAIVDLLAANDRPYETPHAQAMQAVFQGIQSAAAPTQLTWDSARIDVDLALVKGIAERIRRASYAADRAVTAPGPAQQHLRTLHQALQDDINDANQIGTTYTAPHGPALTPAQTQTRKDNFTMLHDNLLLVQQAAMRVDPALKADYDNFAKQLQPFTT